MSLLFLNLLRTLKGDEIAAIFRQLFHRHAAALPNELGHALKLLRATSMCVCVWRRFVAIVRVEDTRKRHTGAYDCTYLGRDENKLSAVVLHTRDAAHALKGLHTIDGLLCFEIERGCKVLVRHHLLCLDKVDKLAQKALRLWGKAVVAVAMLNGERARR